MSVDSSEQATLNATVVLSPPDINAGAAVESQALHFQVPQTNHALGEFRLYGYDTLFNGTYDTAYTLGYNSTSGGGRVIATEPQLSWQLETDYNNGSNHSVEYYLQYQPDNTVAAVPTKRVFFMGWRRDSYAETFSPEWRASSLNFRRWDDAAECTASVTPHPCCTGAGVGATCGSIWGAMGPAVLQLNGGVGQSTDTAINLTSQNSKDTWISFTNTANKTLNVGTTNANGPYLTVGGTATSFSFNAAQKVIQQNGIYQVVDTDAGALDPRYSFEDAGTVANTTGNGHTRGSWYSKYTVSGGTSFSTLYGGYFLPTDATTLANTHKGYRCYLGSVTGASTTSQCLDLDAQTGVGGTHTLGVMANGTLTLTAAPFQWNTNPATSGNIRMPNTESACWRNAANSANLCLTTDATNTLDFNGIDVVDVSSTQTLTNKTYVSSAADPADTGVVRLGNAEQICWEQSPADPTDLCLSVNASEAFTFNDLAISTLGANTITGSATTAESLTLIPNSVDATGVCTLSPTIGQCGSVGGYTFVGGAGGVNADLNMVAVNGGSTGQAALRLLQNNTHRVSLHYDNTNTQLNYSGTLTFPKLGGGGTITLPGGTTDTIALLNATQALTNKTYTVTPAASTSFIQSATANPASTGALRVSNTENGLCWRNAGNTADQCISVNATDQLTLPAAALTTSHYLTGDISDTPSTQQDNYAPTGIATASILRVTAGAAMTITGLRCYAAADCDAAADGRVVTIFNSSTTSANILTLATDSGSSTAANRFRLGGSSGGVVLRNGRGITLWYDATTLLWRPMSNTTPVNDDSLNAGGVISGTLAVDPADTGIVRLGNTESICWENATPGTDACLSAGSGLTWSDFAGANHTVATLDQTQTLTNKTIYGGLATTTHEAGANFIRVMQHATDCTAITDGKLGELCYEADANATYICEPDAGDCSGTEWKAVGAAGSGDITDVGDCGGVSGACFTSAAGAGTTLTFHNATSGTIALTPVTGALGTVTLSLPAATDTLVGKATTDDLANKSIVTAGLAFKNATSGTVTLNTVTGALGNVTASLPAKTGTLAMTIDLPYRDVTIIDGAVCDGTTNASTAIQAAVDALTTAGGTLWVPDGKVCVIDTTIVPKSNVSIRCGAKGGFKAKSSLTTAMFKATGAVNDWTVSDCDFNLNALVNINAYYIEDGARWHFNNNYVHGVGTGASSAWEQVRLDCTLGLPCEIVGNTIAGSNTVATNDTCLAVTGGGVISITNTKVTGNQVGFNGSTCINAAITLLGTGATDVQNNTLNAGKTGTSVLNIGGEGQLLISGNTIACAAGADAIFTNQVANNIEITANNAFGGSNWFFHSQAPAGAYISGIRISENYSTMGVRFESMGRCKSTCETNPGAVCSRDADCLGASCGSAVDGCTATCSAAGSPTPNLACTVDANCTPGTCQAPGYGQHNDVTHNVFTVPTGGTGVVHGDNQAALLVNNNHFVGSALNGVRFTQTTPGAIGPLLVSGNEFDQADGGGTEASVLVEAPETAGDGGNIDDVTIVSNDMRAVEYGLNVTGSPPGSSWFFGNNNLFGIKTAATNGFPGSITKALAVITPLTGTGVLTLPMATDTLVGKSTTDDLANKSIVTAGLAFKNATSGTVTINTVAGALGTVTASLPAKTGTIAVGPLMKSLTWFFPGTPATGQQAPRALVPEGVTGCTITNSRISVGTAAGSGSPAYNIARCTTSAGNCTATSNIYSGAVALTTNQSVAGGAPNTATITAGDAFKVDITNVGVTIADITVTMAYTCDQ